MSAQIADFNIRFNTETAQFQKDVDYAKKMLRGYTKEAKVANQENANLTKSLEKSADGAKSAAKGVMTIAGSVTAGLGAVAGATGYLITRQAEHGRLIQQMATVSQVSVEEIQALGYASEQYNISGEKMSDILKDVNDKLGDFTENEGGEFADFMKNVAPTVGLTIEKLQELSGPEALIAVKSAMDAANVPMKSQIFYLESIANDASALMPLLENQGQKLYELTGKYKDLNVSMSEYDIEKFKEMDQKLTDISLKMERSFANAVLGASDQIDWFTDKLTIAIDYWGTKFDSMSDNPKTEKGILAKLGDAQGDAKTARIELERAQKELDSLQATQKNTVGNVEVQARLANSNFSKRVGEAETKVQKLKQDYEALLATVDKYQRQYENDILGFNRTPNSDKPKEPPKPKPRPVNPSELESQQQSGKNRLQSLDVQYANEREKLLLAHEQRLTDIENLKLSEQEIEKRGFDSLAAIKAEYLAREREFYRAELEDFERNQEEALQREIDAYIAKEDAKTQKAEQAAKQRADTEKRIEQSVLAMKFNVASQALSLIEQGAKEGSLIQKAAFASQKAMAAAQVWMQGEVAAAAALSPPPIGLGTIAGAGQATLIRAMAAASAGMIMGQAIVGMAHNGISEVPMYGGRTESNWTLKAGERVYTNESAQRIDQMYQATMAIYRQRFAANDPSNKMVNSMTSISSGAGTDSPSVFQFNFSAIDTTGMEQLIRNNRDSIYNAVASAKRDRGEKF
ncbi:hypothetical protein ACOV11_07190 [Vibrio natriegens]